MFYILRRKFKVPLKTLKKFVPEPLWKFLGREKLKRHHASKLVK